ncbi:MAG TPA: hypothetical protein VGB15_10435 [Longimicrobium sp.]
MQAGAEAPEVRALPGFVGAAWQFAASTDVLDRVERCPDFRPLYQAP